MGRGGRTDGWEGQNGSHGMMGGRTDDGIMGFRHLRVCLAMVLGLTVLRWVDGFGRPVV
jgi:hypothetical protein